MPATQQELDNFHRFAVEQLRHEAPAASLEELLARWRTARQRTEVNGAIREGLAPMNAGLGRPLDEFMADFRARHQVSADA